MKFIDGKERNYANMQVNPCKMCMPMGGAQALKGIRNAMTIIHGSQGCSTYIRRHMAAHYNEPVDIASSSLSEEGTVYGGSKNLKLGIRNLVDMYEPEIVGVLTSCLAETIGDDIDRIVKEVRESGDFEGVDIIPIATPGYGGSQSEGYFKALQSILHYYARGRQDTLFEEEMGGHINIIISNATCEDVRAVKDMVKAFGVEAIVFPDISDALDAPYTPDFKKLSAEGTGREDIKRMFSANATIELGDLADSRYSPAAYLEDSFDIPAYRMPLPIGIHNTDRFVESLSSILNKPIPENLEMDRGRLIDGMIDAHKHSAMGRVAVFGDPDLVFAMSGFLAENGAKVHVAATGSINKRFRTRMDSLLARYGYEGIIMQDSDFETIRDRVIEQDVNLMLGSSDGKFIEEKDGIDLLRVGFPVHDHIGAQRKLYMGYKGSLWLLDSIANKLLDMKHNGYRERMYDTYYPKEVLYG